MIITLGFLIMIVIGEVVLRMVKDSFDHDGLYAISACVVTLGVIGLFICICFIASSHIFANKNIHSAKMQRESLVKQMEVIASDYEDISRTKVISKVYDWNNDVYDTKIYSVNPVTNWFYSKKYVNSLKYIVIDDYLPQK